MAAVAPFVGPAISGIGAISSGIGGKGAQRALNQQADYLNQAYRPLLDAGTGAFNQISDQMQLFQNQGLANDVMRSAYATGQNVNQIAQQGAAGIGQGGYMDQARYLAEGAGNFDQWNFDPTRQFLGDTVAAAQQAGDVARAGAMDAARMNMRAGESALDAQLAARGLSRNSGAGAAGISNLAAQNAMARAQLEGNIANQTSQAALQAGQIDTANRLQLEGLGSQYTLGMNQLGAQTALGQAGVMQGLQGLSDQQAIQRAGLLSQGAMAQHDLLQGTYQNNYLNPLMQTQGMLGSLGGALTGIGQTGLGQLLAGQTEAVKQAGSGKGAGMSGLSNGLTSALGGKQANQAPRGPSLGYTPARGGPTWMQIQGRG